MTNQRKVAEMWDCIAPLSLMVRGFATKGLPTLGVLEPKGKERLLETHQSGMPCD